VNHFLTARFTINQGETTMIKKALACTLCLGSLFAVPASANDRDILFKFDGGIGSQPFRNVGGVATPNTVAGVAPGGTPWPIRAFKAQIGTDGRIRASAKGILLGGGDGIGTRATPRQMAVSLFCRNAPVAPALTGTLQTAAYTSEFVDLDTDGNFKLDSTLKNAGGATPTADCGDTAENRPVLLIRTVTAATATTPAAPGSWFAAGILKSDSDD
jgi:hypothetical protein